MPHVIVKMHSGRSDAEKQELADRLSQAVGEVLNHGPDAISVAIHDVPPSDWMGTVYEPDIAGDEDHLFKRPGYGSLAQ